MAALAAAAPTITAERARSGPLTQRVATADDADLVIFYTSEQAGKLGTCGCAQRPRGGMARLHSYLDAARNAQPHTPDLLVHAGRWASDRIGTEGTLRQDARIANTAMVQALELAGIDAANISWRDAPTFAYLERPDWAVSATLGPTDAAVVHRVRAGALDVALIGASPFEADWLQPPGWTGRDPVDAVRAAIEGLDHTADLVVVLAWNTGSQTSNLAELPGVDVLVEAGDFVGRDIPWADEDTVWVRSRSEGQSVGELRLWLDETGGIEAVVDRWIDLDDRIPEQGRQKRLARKTDRAQTAWLQEALELR